MQHFPYPENTKDLFHKLSRGFQVHVSCIANRMHGQKENDLGTKIRNYPHNVVCSLRVRSATHFHIQSAICTSMFAIVRTTM